MMNKKNHRVEARAHKPVGGVQAAAPEAVALVAFWELFSDMD